MSDANKEPSRNRSRTIILAAHYSETDAVHEASEHYYRRFPDVEIRKISTNLPPFPKCVGEVDLDLLKQAKPFYDKTCLDAILLVEKEGYGAVVTASETDPGVKDARGKTSIPVVGMLYANCARARQLGKKFSVLFPFEKCIDIFRAQILDYGFGRDLISVEHLDFDPLYHIANRIAPDFDALMPAALRNVHEARKKGAELIFVGCGSPDLSEFAPKLHEVSMAAYDLPVLTPIDTAIETARHLIASRQGRG